MLMDAKGTLVELQKLADSPEGSQLRFQSRVLLPGMAKRLREVGMAAPIAAALATGTRDKEAELSENYGGAAGTKGGAADPVYASIGRVVTISGRTIRYEAQHEPEIAASAIHSIEALLSQIPSDVLDKVQRARAGRD